jgi:hypothetical protein
VAPPALLLWLFVADGALHLTTFQWLGVLSLLRESGRAFVVGIRATPGGDLVLRNHLHTHRVRREDCDSAMVAQSRRPFSFEWSVYLVLRDGTHHCVHATTVPSREWSDRRAQRQAAAINAWIYERRPAPPWAPTEVLTSDADGGRSIGVA